MPLSVVDRLQGEFSDLISALDKAGEISLRSTADENLRKALLLAAASYFEHRMIGAILNYVSESTKEHKVIVSLIRNKAISRQYHTWFNWEAKNANSFFGMFGDGFREFMKRRVKEDEELDEAIRAFLELGSDRNRLVHQDFGSFALEKTSEEIYELYRTGLKFVNAFPEVLEEFGG